MCSCVFIPMQESGWEHGPLPLGAQSISIGHISSIPQTMFSNPSAGYAQITSPKQRTFPDTPIPCPGFNHIRLKTRVRWATSRMAPVILLHPGTHPSGVLTCHHCCSVRDLVTAYSVTSVMVSFCTQRTADWSAKLCASRWTPAPQSVQQK